MDDSLKVILRKLDDIDSRLKTLERGKSTAAVTIKPTASPKSERDPQFLKAVEIINKQEEISALSLAQMLKIEKERAEALLDQLEAAGYGECSWREG